MDLRNLDERIPRGYPTLREWEINENTTRYERLQAAPTDDGLLLAWSLWIALCTRGAIFVALVMVSILLDRKARSNPFNQFLICLMVPDFLVAALFSVSCILNVLAGQYWSDKMCQFQSFYIVFATSGNSWLNLAAGWELHSLLRASKGFQKYKLPSARRITFTAVSVYAYCCFIASWALWAGHVDNFPHRIVSFSRLGCMPLDYSRHSSIFFYLVYMPLLVGIPFFAIFGMGFHIWYNSLMPPTGRRRTLAIFFGRIMAVFAIMWLPSFVFGLTGAGRPWLVFVGGSFGLLQGTVSAAITLTKPDIRDAFSRLIRCRFGKTNVAPSFSTDFSFPPPLRDAVELCNHEFVDPQDSASPRHLEPSRNERSRSDHASCETGAICEMAAEEDDERACWPD